MDQVIDKKEEQALKDLHSRMAGKPKPEQAELLRAYMQEHCDVKFDDKPMVQLSDEQVRMIVNGGVEAAKLVAAEKAGEVERRYDLDGSHARSIVDDEVSSVLEKQARQHEDLKMASEVIATIARTKIGHARAGDLQSVYDKEAEYIKKNWSNRHIRAMSLTTDTTGGYLGGEIFSSMLYENVSRHSYARRYATIMTMEREILRIPKLTTTLTAEQTSEAGTITASQPVMAQFTLSTKKINVLTKPFSVELLETAEPALIQALIDFATREIAKKEDELVFSTSSPGILSHSTNKVTCDSGRTAITDILFDDLSDLIYELDPHYVGYGEDVRGSGMFAKGTSHFWLPHAAVRALVKQKGNDDYYWADVKELKHEQRIHGYGLKVVPTMSNAPSAGDNVACFGDLGYMVCGVRPGFRIDLQNQGTVDSVNLNETNSYAVRVTEFFDNDSIDDEAFSILELAAS